MTLRAVFNLAVEKGLLDRAPTDGIRAETIVQKRVDLPDMASLAGLHEFLKGSADAGAAALLLIMYTGADKREILQARWENLSQDRTFLFVKTARKNMMRRICLPAEAAEILQRLPRSDSPWIFPGQDPSKPLSDLFRYWDRARRQYDCAGLRICDLGRIYAAWRVEQGDSLQYLRVMQGEQVFRKLRRASLVSVDESGQPPAIKGEAGHVPSIA